MANSRTTLLRVLTGLDLLFSALVSLLIYLLWSNHTDAIPDYLDILRQWPPEKVFIYSFIAAGCIVLFSIIAYCASFRVREERRPVISIYLIAVAAVAPFAAMAAYSVGENSIALAASVFAATVLLGGLLVFAFEFIMGNLAKIIAAPLENWEMHGIAGRLFAIASMMLPSDPQLLRRQAFAQFMADNYRRAIPVMERLRARGEQDVLLLERLQSAYRHEHQSEKEVDVLRELLHFRPGEVKYLRLQAQAYERLERWDEALAAREAALDARNVAQLEEVARLALRANNVDQAIAHARKLRELEGKPYKRSLEINAEIVEAAPNSIETLVEMAEMHLRLDNEPKAVALWERILTQEPARNDVRRRLLESYQRTGHLEEEEKHLRMLWQNEREDAGAVLRLAENLSEQKRMEESRAILKQAINIFPVDPRFAYEYSRMSLAAGNLDEAEHALKIAEGLADKADISRVGALRRRIEAERVNRELQALREKIQQAPNDAQLRYQLVERLFKIQDLPAVRFELDQLLNALPAERPHVIENLRAMIQEAEQKHQLQDYLADLLFADRDFGRVFALYEEMAQQSFHGESELMQNCEKILRVAPDFIPALARFGSLLCKDEQWERCIEINSHLLELTDQYNADKVRELYRAHLAIGKVAEAESFAQTLLAEEPRNVELRQQLINGYEERQRYEDAVRLAKECAELAPENMSFARRLDILTRKRKRQRIDELESQLIVRPDDAQMHFELGDLYEQFQEYDEAIANFQRASRDEHLHNLAIARLGHALALRGMHDLASETLAQVKLDDAANGKEELKTLLYESGLLFEEGGNNQRALEVYKAIFRIDASFRDIVGRLSRYRT